MHGKVTRLSNTTHILERLKRWAAAALLVCFFLPLCQCTAKAIEPRAPPGTHQQKDIVVVPAAAIEFQTIQDAPWIAAFFWPFVAWRARRRPAGKKAIIVLNIVEVGCSAASIAFVIGLVQLFGTLRYGGILAVSALAVHLLSSLGVVASGVWVSMRPPGGTRSV